MALKIRSLLIARSPPLTLFNKLKSCSCFSGRASQSQEGPALKDFMALHSPTQPQALEDTDSVPYLSPEVSLGHNRKVYFETYGCQMNVNDTDIAWTFLKNAGFERTTTVNNADVILAVTCAIRENAEQKVWSRLNHFRNIKKKRKSSGTDNPPLKIGVLGCMAERLKESLLETDKMVDLVAGPDSYRDLPRLLSSATSGQKAVNVLLSLDETYADVMPVRIDQNSTSAFVSIMRGCDNMCSFCIVPFTRGRERSRPINSILEEVSLLSNQGVKEVTLLGQNVNSYRDVTSSTIPITHSTSTQLSDGFSSIYRSKEGGRRFADLLDKVAEVDPEMRIRFTSPHPKDFPQEVLQVMKSHDNICKSVHLPVQSGSSRMMSLMRRGYTRESYLQLVSTVRSALPGVTLSSDFIAGFCGEQEEDHQQTLSLLSEVQYEMAYMFAYSMRKKTHAYHWMVDDVPDEIKQRRLREVIDVFHSHADATRKRMIGSQQLVLVKGRSKRSSDELVGLTDGNIRCVFPDRPLKSHDMATPTAAAQPGDYVAVKITESTPLTLRGEPLHKTLLASYYSNTSAQNTHSS